jgi:hypothetical protein
MLAAMQKTRATVAGGLRLDRIHVVHQMRRAADVYEEYEARDRENDPT